MIDEEIRHDFNNFCELIMYSITCHRETGVRENMKTPSFEVLKDPQFNPPIPHPYISIRSFQQNIMGIIQLYTFDNTYQILPFFINI